MINLNKLMAGITPTGWLIVAIFLVVWVAFTYFMGAYSEKKWGDREPGALVGFFVPSLLFALYLYIC
ncbi:MAG: hypothetical protein PUP46_00280 [Endozoicomonas sp. (ex Botrylloides leachii)]|nr:hypothetical protein [Endozoicomonas sp. (ex Botrylloides leachii)]